MEILFENLKKIDTIVEKLEALELKISGEKRWLNVSEASNYIGYSKDHIHKLKDNHLIEGKHYFKKAGRVLFDKLALDNWVTISAKNINPKEIAESILKDLI
ncbi:helix-turn-helix domain-containing protein [Aliarcobacter cibarius]|uniref:Helix-turn-helix domain-containing protein n=1 Tax=Aliarcobacter cibarius TaxID=255507 RepID=A0ABY2V4G7_9BACT|nr:helix-turn-helix domain-containing protein [Aliarcobacter cibarius]TLS99572.1 helix-turn-helix domain-containing protein [Aliarcobacter cibarius]TLT00009.1 helix-turn-helix domain-containing protein [Aliarcobacter cibarius]TLT03489.1 helix-turn-helix domain-containing protein [Aliarcobacter cibarius]